MLELTFVMPCLNEAATLAECIDRARMGAQAAGVDDYEIVVADNGSSDGSQQIARSSGARVIDVPVRGYGAALRAGIEAAQGRFVIMGDSDGSYDFSEIASFLKELGDGAQLVLGTRIRGRIEPKAMPALHRYFGNPILTFIGNLFFASKLSDYHSGLRAFDRNAILDLNLHTQGMEFASEMIIRATIAGMKISEVPITYRKDGRSRPPHLRPWSDGWRHFRFMLLYNPRWLFLYPGIVLSLLGLAVSAVLFPGPFRAGNITLDIHTLLISSTVLVMGVQLVMFAVFARAYSARAGLLPHSPRLERFLDSFSLNLGLLAGILIVILGLVLYGIGFVIWSEKSFGPLIEYQRTLRIVIAGTTLVILGMQVSFGSFLVSLLSIRLKQDERPIREPELSEVDDSPSGSHALG